nr:molybdenum cofactor biosynthesis protein MoaE [Parapontixanthobacter aurantiacus]
MAAPVEARVLDKGLSVGEAQAAFSNINRLSGGIASFLGKVRDDGETQALELTHYAPLTEPAIRELAQEALSRFALDGVLVWHRIGVMTRGQPIVLVMAAAPHRRAAFDAVDFLMDHLKSASWLWKREKRGGTWEWIEPRAEDRLDLSRWT